MPFSRAVRSSVASCFLSRPPCILRALTVATITTPVEIRLFGLYIAPALKMHSLRHALLALVKVPARLEKQ